MTTPTPPPTPPPETPADPPWPVGVYNAHWFSLLNNVSFQITLGAPAVLYAKSLGASATVLGIMSALTPLLASLQLPAAKYLPKYGYRRFTLAGWGLRTVAIFAIAVIPLLGSLGVSDSVQLLLVLLALLVFNIMRGLASGAWLPWITELIPQALRGRFLGRDQMFGNFGALMAFLAAASLLGGGPGGKDVAPWQFTLVFLLSGIAGVVSLWFCARIPEPCTPERMKSSGHPVPWKEMFLWPPFLKLVVFNLGWVALSGGLGTFTVSFLRGVVGYSDREVLLLSACGLFGSMVSVTSSGSFADRFGSGPVLRACLALLIVVLAGWALVSGGVLPSTYLIVAWLSFLTGVATIGFFVANNRLVMATLPIMGRNHFSAMYSVVTSIGLGLSPIIWGILLDLIGNSKWSTFGAEWNRYSVYFLAVAILAITTAAGSYRLVEPGPAKS